MKNRTLLWVEWFSTVDIANENRHETGWFGVMRKQRRSRAGLRLSPNSCNSLLAV